MTFINTLDSITLFCSFLSLFFLAIGFFRGKSRDNNIIIFSLFALNFLYSLFLWLQWTDIAPNYEKSEDFLGALLPMFWALFYYSFILLNKNRLIAMNEERFKLAVIGGGLGTWDWKIDNEEVIFNGCTAKMLEREKQEELPLSFSWEELVHEDDLPVLKELIFNTKEKNHLFEKELRLKQSNGSWTWTLLRGQVTQISREGKATRASGTILDISKEHALIEERTKLELLLQRSQRLKSIGRLAGGVAHDLNNLLTPILAYSEMLEEECQDEEQYQTFHDISYAANRAKDLIKQLLFFCRKHELKVETFNLNDTIITFKSLLERTIPESMVIEVNLGAKEAFVLADAGQVEQIIMNLSINAACACKNKGAIVISTSVIDFPSAVHPKIPEMEDGKYVLLEISDDGCGMEPEAMDHIFEPFYSTKGDEGTGLGLSTVYGIVKKHQGHINVSSRVGKGSTFTIYLPFQAVNEEDIPSAQKSVKSLTGQEAVLVVDDSDVVLKLTKAALEKLGYVVLEAETAEKALNIIQDSAVNIDLLVCDIVLPKMNGCKLYDLALEIRPKLKVLYMSGYASELVKTLGAENHQYEYIQKPFSVSALASRVDKLLH